MHAQQWDERAFVHLSVKDGLSNDRITSLQQDKHGYLWIGTWKGLNRYDGREFRHFLADTSASSMPQDYVHRLVWLHPETLGVCTPSGMHLRHTSTLKGENRIIPGAALKQLYKINNVMDALSDPAGNIYLLSRSGFYHFDATGKLAYRYDHYTPEQENTEAFVFGRSMTFVDDSRLLIATSAGMYVYHTGLQQLQPAAKHGHNNLAVAASQPGSHRFFYADRQQWMMPFATGNQLAIVSKRSLQTTTLTLPWPVAEKFDWRSAIFRLNDSTFAITGKNNGFYFIHHNTLLHTFRFDSTLHFGSYYCSALFTDHSGRLWIGTNKGLFRQKRNSGLVERFEIPAALNPAQKELSIRALITSNGKLFAATSSEGVWVLDKQTMQPLRRIDLTRHGRLANMVFTALPIHQDTIVLGAMGAAIWLNTSNFQTGSMRLPAWNAENDWVSSIYKDSRGDLYLCRNTNNEYFLRSRGSHTFHLVTNNLNPLFDILVTRGMAEDAEGHLWFGGHGISRLNYRTRQFDKLIDSFPAIKLARKEVIAPLFGADGNMYFGVTENGLMIYDVRTGRFEQLTRSEGLPENNVKALALHGNKLWIGTEQGGFAYYDLRNKKITSFGMADDIPASSFTSVGFCLDTAANRMYAAFSNEIIRFDPDKLTSSSEAPAFFIESLQAGNDKWYHPSQSITLDYQNNNLTLHLGSVNFEDASQQQFAWRFASSGNEPWISAGFQRSLVIGNLEPGKHVLQVKTSIDNNSWPDQVQTLTIMVKPPFWKTNWFRLVLGAAFIGVLLLLYQLRIRSVRQKANIDRQLAEMEMKGLHAQMNPHFIFNSLNSIKEMILHDEKQQASRYLSRFAQLIRTTLDQSQQTFVSVGQCIDHLKQYLDMEQLRFSDFSYEIHTDADMATDDVQLPPMLVQPLVENAIWHGLLNKAGEKRLLISFSEDAASLICTIEDNGIGLHAAQKQKQQQYQTHRSVGIANIRERLAVLNEKYHMHCTLELHDLSDTTPDKQGTIAILKLTRNHAKYDQSHFGG